MKHPGSCLDSPGPDELLFAYGTLQRGGRYHALLEQCHAEFVGTGELVTAYPLILAQYPCLLDQPGKGYCVSGELYRLHQSADWIAIDRLEAHPHEYRRRPEPVRLGAATVLAWTYFYRFPESLDPRLKPVPHWR